MNERQWLIKALVGSHNYNLNTETSDKDYKVFVLPTFNDLYEGEKFSKSITSDTEDVSIHDIRMFVNMLYKANVNFIEVLFSKELIINPDLQPSSYKMITEMIKNREEYAKMNLPYLWDACIGMYYQNTKKMNYVDINEGFLDYKKAMTAYRILDFLERYAKNIVNPWCREPFKEAINYNKEEREFLLKIKEGKIQYLAMKDMLDSKFASVSKYKFFYKESEVNERLKLELERDIKKLVYKNI